MAQVQDCLFCRIVAGDVPADVVRQDERTVSFRDISPKAPTHVLVVPREHHADVAALAATDPTTLAELVTTGADIAAQECDGEFSLIFNTGAGAGQSVFHAHGHVIGGRREPVLG